MKKRKQVWIIDEGSQGHVVQSRGLVRELGKTICLESTEITARLKARSGIAKSVIKRLMHRLHWHWLFAATHSVGKIPNQAPDLIISSGPRSLLALEYFSKIWRCPAVFVQGSIHVPPGIVDVIMRPNGDAPREDFIFIPLLFNEITPEVIERAKFDYQVAHPNENPSPLRALFIGQSSAKIRFADTDWDSLIELVNRSWKQDGIRWLITTSSRTGKTLEKRLRSGIFKEAIFDAVWYASSPRPVTKEFLALADTVYVTVESLTMLSEAVCSGRPVIAISPAALALNLADSHQRYVAGLANSGFLQLHVAGQSLPTPSNGIASMPDYGEAIRQLTDRIGWTTPNP